MQSVHSEIGTNGLLIFHICVRQVEGTAVPASADFIYSCNSNKELDRNFLYVRMEEEGELYPFTDSGTISISAQYLSHVFASHLFC